MEELAVEVIIELHTSGYFKYFDKEGVIPPSLDEYKLLHILIEGGKKPVSYSDLVMQVLGKSDSFDMRREIQQVVKRLKPRLGIRPSDKYKLVESSSNYGYYLDLKGNETAIIVP